MEIVNNLTDQKCRKVRKEALKCLDSRGANFVADLYWFGLRV
jgi:hypothetical protein